MPADTIPALALPSDVPDAPDDQDQRRTAEPRAPAIRPVERRRRIAGRLPRAFTTCPWAILPPVPWTAARAPGTLAGFDYLSGLRKSA